MTTLKNTLAAAAVAGAGALGGATNEADAGYYVVTMGYATNEASLSLSETQWGDTSGVVTFFFDDQTPNVSGSGTQAVWRPSNMTLTTDFGAFVETNPTTNPQFRSSTWRNEGFSGSFDDVLFSEGDAVINNNPYDSVPSISNINITLRDRAPGEGIFSGPYDLQAYMAALQNGGLNAFTDDAADLRGITLSFGSAVASGQITSLDVQYVPAPAVPALLAAAGIVAARRKRDEAAAPAAPEV